MRRTERAAYRTKFYSNLSSPTRFDEEPKRAQKRRAKARLMISILVLLNLHLKHRLKYHPL